MAAKISIIAAVARHFKGGNAVVNSVNRKKILNAKDKKTIGINNTLPWNIPEDLRNFKKLTFGNPIVMGRKTFDSIGKPLPGRRNIVISRNSALKIENCEIANSLDAAIRIAKSQNPDEVFIIGGAQIYEQAMQFADRLYLTEINQDVKGDAFFPNFSGKKWKEIRRRQNTTAPLLEKNQNENSPRFDFVVYEKN